ncbi:NADH-quinone oxidoreductase subunit C [Candidatus Woesearchaeota archaeon]|nr:NADH-quinone oxidoreductase subunit C [Candidatus Woesearchaeota archaeon]
MTRKKTASELVQELKKKFGDSVKEVREAKRAYCIKKKETCEQWVTIDPAVFKQAVQYIADQNYPFLSVISGRDAGNDIELTYHFFIKPDPEADKACTENGLFLRVAVPKSKPVLPTITDIIPGALLSELEKQEMLGVTIEGIGNQRAFLPEKHPQGNYPWRKDKNA